MADSLETIVRKHALKNAFDYGTAELKSVAGKVIAEAPDCKADMTRTMGLVASEVERANGLSKEELEKELAGFVFAERKEVKREKWEIPGAEDGKVVTRFLPEPNGFLHLGHAKAAFLSAELARQYNGKFLLRFDDTNPEKEKGEFVQAIREDAGWLGLKFDSEETFVSDFMPKFYDYARKLVSQGDAYACTCAQEIVKQHRMEKKACACRAKTPAENLSAWESMLSGSLGEGAATLRLKGSLESDNTVMRDPTLFRILETPHYRQGTAYKVWPTYDFEASISDSITGVTHAFRSKEYELRDELYHYLLEKLSLRQPFVYDFSRLNIRGNALSKRNLKPLVEGKKVSGWDDPRLLTLRGMKRRGILPQAIREFVLSFGLSKVESSPSIEKLLNENQKLLEPSCDHYFFVEKPVKVLVKNSKEGFIKIPKQPADASKGNRVLHAQKDFYISKADADAAEEGDFLRFKSLYCVKLLEKKPNGLVVEYAGKDVGGSPRTIQWVPANEAVAAELMIVGDLFKPGGQGDEFNPKSLDVESGFCEVDCRKLAVGGVVQLERVGLARLDDAKRMRFILSSFRG